jgi:hypothetical protein
VFPVDVTKAPTVLVTSKAELFAKYKIPVARLALPLLWYIISLVVNGTVLVVSILNLAKSKSLFETKTL